MLHVGVWLYLMRPWPSANSCNTWLPQYVGYLEGLALPEQGEGLLAKYLDRPELVKDVLNLVSVAQRKAWVISLPSSLTLLWSPRFVDSAAWQNEGEP